jgi:2-polyprenyl-6-methoxyphenol hydroxylase-like FAD-dependent oxidoreductase
MRYTDIAIVGGGLAGSLTAATLGRAGANAVLIDPHPMYPPDFRAEKLDGGQIQILHRTGLAEPVLSAGTTPDGIWIVRLRRLVDTLPGDQCGILYENLVNTVRGQIPAGVSFVSAKVSDIIPGPERQSLTLSTGETLSARLVVIANGLNSGLRDRLGMTREELSKCHSIMLGFDMRPVAQPRFQFPALTYYAERSCDRTAFLTLFPVADAMRANLCVYRTMDDPWLKAFRDAPEATLLALMPGLVAFTGTFAVSGPVKIRPADLYVTRGHIQPGIVVVGDAFATSCPAAGTGTGKVFTDVERLCNVHIPRWFESPGMGEDKIAQFYDDPIKKAYDLHSHTKAYYLRSLSIEPGLSWEARRWVRFMGRLGVGLLREAHARLAYRVDDGSATTQGNQSA